MFAIAFIAYFVKPSTDMQVLYSCRSRDKIICNLKIFDRTTIVKYSYEKNVLYNIVGLIDSSESGAKRFY